MWNFICNVLLSLICGFFLESHGDNSLVVIANILAIANLIHAYRELYGE